MLHHLMSLPAHPASTLPAQALNTTKNSSSKNSKLRPTPPNILVAIHSSSRSSSTSPTLQPLPRFPPPTSSLRPAHLRSRIPPPPSLPTFLLLPPASIRSAAHQVGTEYKRECLNADAGRVTRAHMPRICLNSCIRNTLMSLPHSCTQPLDHAHLSTNASVHGPAVMGTAFLHA